MATDWRAALADATRGLTLQSECDAALHPLRWPIPGPVTVDALRAYLALPDAIPVEVRPVAALLAPQAEVKDWFGPDERATAERFQNLAALLAGLEHPQAFRIGAGPDIAVYVLGADPAGGWAGFASHVTET